MSNHFLSLLRKTIYKLYLLSLFYFVKVPKSLLLSIYLFDYMSTSNSIKQPVKMTYPAKCH